MSKTFSTDRELLQFKVEMLYVKVKLWTPKQNLS